MQTGQRGGGCAPSGTKPQPVQHQWFLAPMLLVCARAWPCAKSRTSANRLDASVVCDYPYVPMRSAGRIINMDARALHTGDSGYPARLHALAEPPTPLWIRGDWTPARRAVALVGARAATARGLEAARELGARLAAAGVDVVSGGALGIDAGSHRGALDVADRSGAGRTVAVLGTGIDVAYPERNAGLFDEIVASGGALVSQFEPGMQPHKGSF